MCSEDAVSAATSQNTKPQATGSHLAQTYSKHLTVCYKSNLNRLNCCGVETSEKRLKSQRVEPNKEPNCLKHKKTNQIKVKS